MPYAAPSATGAHASCRRAGTRGRAHFFSSGGVKPTGA
ncbi:hypothetical protein C7S14_0162 [Burkholderia cepacia]|nr:hypothetical protein C7S14_0162 [Burkholderia cepacia]